MRRNTFLFLAVTGLIASVGVANADYAFNNFGPPDPNWGNGWTVSGTSAQVGHVDSAEQFVAGVSGELSEIDAAVGLAAGSNAITATLYMDNGFDAFGTMLGTWTDLGAMNAFGNPSVVAFLGGPTINLVAGTTYWLSLTAGADDTWAAWSLNGIGDTRNLMQNGNLFGGNTSGAFSVRTRVLTPEPISMSLGIASVGLFLRRRKQAK